MKVFYKSMIEELTQMMCDFELRNGVKPTHVEMSKVEYRKMQDQLKIKYPYLNTERPADERTVLGLLITIKE